jgi:hypothetical protein
MNDSRYQFQPWPIKAYRWLRWVPLYACVAAWRVALWAITGARVPLDDPWPYDRLRYCGHIWRATMSLALFEMGNWVTLDEAMAELRARSESKA